MKRITASLAVLCLLLISACTSKPVDDFNHHAITISGDGNIRSPNNANQGSAPSQKNAEGFSILGPDQYGKYLDDLFANLDASKKDNILIFVHGGLNNLKASTERVNKLIQKYNGNQLNSYYPILINWDSGFFESYGEHLFFIRQGETNKTVAIPTSPFYFAADAGRGLVRFPIDAGYVAVRDIQSVPDIDRAINKYRVNTDLLYAKLKTSYPQNISRGEDMPWGMQSFYKVPVNILTWPFQIVTAPAIDGFGTPAWDGMQRRTKVLYNNPEEFDIEREAGRVDHAIAGLPTSVMSEFATRLDAYMTKKKGQNQPLPKITLVGHSMGTFIINELLRKYPDITYQNIVYMAGADSIRHTFNSVLPYLEKHEQTKFYNLTLHPQNEIEEPNYYLLPRGSLLVWIDDFFSTPLTQYDRTVGRWENLIQAYGEIPETMRGRVFIKAFDQKSPIATHKDFGGAEFWEESFWKPKVSESAPAATIKLYD